jgi:LmbE family N-acetylglucosaminyl deacetylase
MATLLCLHAHPDDEAIATAGLIMRASAAGHRVVLVVATTGELGLDPLEGLAEGESLADRRRAEMLRSAEILGVHRTEFLGYRDSGMNGDHTNHDPASFWQAEIDHAARRLVTLVAEETIDVLTIYDDHGGYDHPDHIQVHRVGTRFAEQAGIDEVYWATMNRDEIARQLATAAELYDQEPPEVDTETFGMAEGELTHAVDVGSFIERKRAAMRAHASQIREDSFFLSMSDEVFALAFGTEWFHRPGAQPGNETIPIAVRS